MGIGMDISVFNATRTGLAINAYWPDVVGLQEVDNMTRRSAIDETTELARLTGMEGYFLQNRVYQDGGYGVAILTRTTPLERREFHYHAPEQPAPRCDRQPTTLADYCQGALALKLRDTESGELFWFVTTHIGLSGMQTPEVTELVDEFLPTLDGARAVFVTGDFNSVPTDTCMKAIQAQYTDTWDVCGAGNGWTFDSANPFERIDYIFQRPNVFKCKKAVVPDTQASDHRPVYADFQL